MIESHTGDILNADAEAIVNTVNCVGIMGRGIALQFKKAFPENFAAYALACDLGEVQPGKMFVYETKQLTNPRFIINFPTKRHWKGKSRIEDIDSGLAALVNEIKQRNIRSIAVPPLGSGLGGLDWSLVRPRIVKALEAIPGLMVLLYEPRGAPDPKVIARTKDVPKMSQGRAALVTLINRYLSGLLDPFVTLLEVHKLMYFMQEGGQPLRLRYQKALYGPFAENLTHVLREIEGHYIIGYADGGDAPTKQLEIVPGALPEAERLLQGDSEMRRRFERVASLVEGFESPFGLELLSTVHWIATREGAKTPQEAAAATYAWNARKRQFSERQIEVAFKTLSEQGWLTAA